MVCHMATIILFHSALGLDDGMHQMAQVFTDAGHTVHLPDYYAGKVFTNTADGLAYRDEVTFPVLANTAAEVVAQLSLPASLPVVFGGFSLGAAMAQSFAKRHPQATGALLFHAGGTPKPTSWQKAANLQIHHTVGDPFYAEGEPELLVRCAAQAGAHASHFVYPGEGHLFADPTKPEYDATLASLMWDRVLAFLHM